MISGRTAGRVSTCLAPSARTGAKNPTRKRVKNAKCKMQTSGCDHQQVKEPLDFGLGVVVMDRCTRDGSNPARLHVETCGRHRRGPHVDAASAQVRTKLLRLRPLHR